MIFDEATLRKLNTLSLVARQVRSGAFKGERRSSKRGSSIEFADYRDYVSGDDLRRVDWNVYARLDRPYIKLLEDEEDLAVHILLDASNSMDWGQGDEHKFTYARRLAAGLGSMALSTGDRLKIEVLVASGMANSYGPARGGHHLMKALSFLESLETSGSTDINASLHNFSLARQRPGLVVLISDLFSPNGYESGVSALQSRGHEVVLIHVLAQDELDPHLAGDLQLIDVETGAKQEISLDNNLRRKYSQRVTAWQDDIQAYCRSRGVHYLPLSTAHPWERFLLYDLRAAGVVQ
ncbi:MAG: DUF58 domain-containing protein [Chloroflexi bacterium]|nr:DUF58 domain-containing protein [Chloroflexota bacterium]